MNSWIFARLAALTISTIDTSRELSPYAIFSRIVTSNKAGSCDTGPIWERNHFTFKLLISSEPKSWKCSKNVYSHIHFSGCHIYWTKSTKKLSWHYGLNNFNFANLFQNTHVSIVTLSNKSGISIGDDQTITFYLLMETYSLIKIVQWELYQIHHSITESNMKIKAPWKVGTMGEIDVHGGQLEFVSPILYSENTLVSNHLKTTYCGLNRMPSSELMSWDNPLKVTWKIRLTMIPLVAS